MAESDREIEQKLEPDACPDLYAITPEVRALEYRPTGPAGPAGPSSARTPPLANSTGPVSRKCTHVNDPVASPRLGELGFDIEEYITHHAGSRLDAYRYQLLRRGVGKETQGSFQRG